MNRQADSNAFLLAARERTLLFDGAMGTMLMAQGISGPSADYWTLEHPDAIFAVHKAYADLGVDAIESNTFGSGVIKLSKCGLQDRAQEIITKALDLTKKASAGRCFINGAVGPTGELLSPLGPMSRKDALDNYIEHITRLINEGADTILIESMVDLSLTRIAILAANEVRNRTRYFPILASLSFNPDGRTMMGNTAEAFACLAQKLGADFVGLNCSAGPNELLRTFERLVYNCSIPAFAMPNAGLPYVQNGKTMFPFSPAQMKEAMRPYLALGAHIGGCCGTTPEHIAVLRELIDETEQAHVARPDISDRICSTRLCTTVRDCSKASVVDLHGLDVADAITAISDIDDELALIDLGTLSPEETKAALSEALPILQGSMLGFITHSAEQADTALWLYDGIAALSIAQDEAATAEVAAKYGAVRF